MNNEAVSNIVSAFMLVLIVVGAATGLAIYMSETQKNTLQSGNSMLEYGYEDLQITSTYDTLSFGGQNYTGVGLLFTNPGIRDIQVQGILIDGKYITKGNNHTGNILIVSDKMILYNYTYDINFGGFYAIYQHNISGNWWNISNQNINFKLPQSSITRVLFNESFLKNDLGINLSLPTHNLEVITARGRYFTTTFTYP